MAKPSIPSVSLGNLQLELEEAASELLTAQAAFNSATSRLAKAEEAYSTAVSSLNAGVDAVKAHTRVSPIL